jgi:hypothetical protein
MFLYHAHGDLVYHPATFRSAFWLPHPVMIDASKAK